jgi:hypothetical protein
MHTGRRNLFKCSVNEIKPGFGFPSLSACFGQVCQFKSGQQTSCKARLGVSSQSPAHFEQHVMHSTLLGQCPTTDRSGNY